MITAKPLFILPKRTPSFQDKVEIALGNPHAYPPRGCTDEVNYRQWIYQFALRVGVMTEGQWLYCHDFPMRLLADKLKVDTEVRTTPGSDVASILVPLWFVGAFWWTIDMADLSNWMELHSLRSTKIKADATFRRMTRKLKQYVTERGQHLLLTEVMLAKTEPGPKAVAQVFLRAALDAGIPKPRRARGR